MELYSSVERKHTGVSAETELAFLWILPEETGGEKGVFMTIPMMMDCCRKNIQDSANIVCQ